MPLGSQKRRICQIWTVAVGFAFKRSAVFRRLCRDVVSSDSGASEQIPLSLRLVPAARRFAARLLPTVACWHREVAALVPPVFPGAQLLMMMILSANSPCIFVVKVGILLPRARRRPSFKQPPPFPQALHTSSAPEGQATVQAQAKFPLSGERRPCWHLRVACGRRNLREF